MRVRFWDKVERTMIYCRFPGYWHLENKEGKEIDKKYDNYTLDNFFSYVGFEDMEYTGIKDKNGKDIYKDDIIKAKQYDGKFIFAVIKFGKHSVGYDSDCDICAVGLGFCFKLIASEEYFKQTPYNTEYFGKKWRDRYLGELLDFDDELEVIGNIYENPELLETKK